MYLINNKYKVIKQIGAGAFGTIFKGINIRTNEMVAIKIELISDELKILKYESNIYKILDKLDCIPKIKWYGKDDLYYYMVIELLGNSLENLLQISEKIKLKTILQIGIIF
jgi:serine/threonine protein kinase